jgi:hypothetical protein
MLKNFLKILNLNHHIYCYMFTTWNFNFSQIFDLFTLFSLAKILNFYFEILFYFFVVMQYIYSSHLMLHVYDFKFQFSQIFDLFYPF